ncbi:hypothetical protein HYS42_00600 [Candidatus Saccharibacteria bacterium]|nr:hypothetical protein [Candidatus Saccharibacteria bacterium]
MLDKHLPSAGSIKEQREEVLALLSEFASNVREMRLQSEWPAWSLFPEGQIDSKGAGMLPSVNLICADSPYWRHSGDHLEPIGPYGPYQDHRRIRKHQDYRLEMLPVQNVPFPAALRERLHQLLLSGKPFK